MTGIPIWTSPIIRNIIYEEFGVWYHDAHVRRLLKKIGFSVQRPKHLLANADAEKRDSWVREIYPNLKKKAYKNGDPIVFEDECSFRQDSTLHLTWSRIGKQPLIPKTGQRKTMKVFGSVDITKDRFIYKTDDVFNAATYAAFLEKVVQKFFTKNHKIYYIQDNASYHKSKDIWSWFKNNRKFIIVYNLPPYCPELNAVERLWKYTRKSGTHNCYFETHDDMKKNIHAALRSMQKKPSEISGYLKPFL